MRPVAKGEMVDIGPLDIGAGEARSPGSRPALGKQIHAMLAKTRVEHGKLNADR
jgi:hypothetical protein